MQVSSLGWYLDGQPAPLLLWNLFGKDQLLRLTLRNRVWPHTRRPFCRQGNSSVNAVHRFKRGERRTRLAEQNLSVHKGWLAQKDWQKSDPVGRCICELDGPGFLVHSFWDGPITLIHNLEFGASQVVYIEQFFDRKAQKQVIINDLKLNRMTVKIQITQHEKSRVKLWFSGNHKPVIDISNTEKCKARLIESFQIDLLPCTFQNSYSKVRKRRRNLTANACTTNLFPKTPKGRDMGGEAGANYCQNVLYINLLEIVGGFSIRAWKCRLSRVTFLHMISTVIVTDWRSGKLMK